MTTLLTILSWARPHGSEEVAQFCRDYLDTVPGMTRDAFGNRILRIPNLGGSASRVLWSCHVDTVHAKGGRQSPVLGADGVITLADGKPGQCLGADDGAGIWLMLEMIAAKRPGLYVFHQGEEVGCLGSKWIVQNTPALLADIDAAIALDRAGFSDVITHQSGGRCASDTFATALMGALNNTWGMTYDLCDGGVYTDTIEYRGIVPECINLSVGYDRQHGPRETQDFTFLCGLLKALLSIDFRSLPICRVPSDEWPRQSFRGGTTWDNDRDYLDMEEGQSLIDLCASHPAVAASLLLQLGITVDDFIDETYAVTGDLLDMEERY